MSGAFDSGIFATIAFYVASALTIASAIIVVTQRDLVRAVVALAMSFVGVAAIYFILNAEFIGVVQVLVYVGAISILIAFAVMFIGDLANAGTLSQNRLVSAIAALLLLASVIFVTYNTDWTAIDEVTDPDAVAGLIGRYRQVEATSDDATIGEVYGEIDKATGEIPALPYDPEKYADIGESRRGVLVDGSSHIGAFLIRELILPFETLGLLLIAALIGALVVIRGRREDDAA